jgi:hypothetical protein
MTPSTSTVVMLALAPLIAWRVYVRIRRMVGRQRLSRTRPWVTVTIFSMLVVLIGVTSIAHPVAVAMLGAGVAAGTGLAVYGLRLTRFERTPEGLFYTPSAHLGIALSLLFVGRMLYRVVEVYPIAAHSTAQSPDFMRSPLTLAIFGTLAGYYVAYAVGLIRYRRRVLRERAERAERAASGEEAPE